MLGSLFYLYRTSLVNAVIARLKRLRQPKYLLGALVGGLYFYAFVFRQAFRGMGAGYQGPQTALVPGDFLVEAAGVLLLIALLAWLWPRSRAALVFSEAEVAFLFSAPLTRQSLIHAKLLKAQFGIVLTAILFGFVMRRGSVLGGSAVLHTIGWWVVFSTLSLHFMGASFFRERWMNQLERPWLRQLLSVMLVLVAGAALAWLIQASLPAGSGAFAGDFETIVHTLRQTLRSPPLAWVLQPFQWLLRPYFANQGHEFVLAMGPALLILLAHYLWVVRADVAFEDASIEQSAKHRAAMKQGRFRFNPDRPRKPGSVPFTLSASGWPPLAMLWSNLIALGPLFRLRTIGIVLIVAWAGIHWLAANPVRESIITFIALAAAVLAAGLTLFGPMWMRRQAQQLIERMDISKAYPIPGWQLVLAELLSPLVLITLGQWLLLLISVMATLYSGTGPMAALGLGAAGMVIIVLMTPPLSGLLLCVPLAGSLYFPAWAGPGGGTEGIEIMGQRLIAAAAFMIVTALALIPAAIVAVLAFLAIQYLLATAPAIVGAAIVASAIVLAECAMVVRWLGGKVERFDLSTELNR